MNLFKSPNSGHWSYNFINVLRPAPSNWYVRFSDNVVRFLFPPFGVEKVQVTQQVKDPVPNLLNVGIFVGCVVIMVVVFIVFKTRKTKRKPFVPCPKLQEQAARMKAKYGSEYKLGIWRRKDIVDPLYDLWKRFSTDKIRVVEKKTEADSIPSQSISASKSHLDPVRSEDNVSIGEEECVQSRIEEHSQVKLAEGDIISEENFEKPIKEASSEEIIIDWGDADVTFMDEDIEVPAEDEEELTADISFVTMRNAHGSSREDLGVQFIDRDSEISREEHDRFGNKGSFQEMRRRSSGRSSSKEDLGTEFYDPDSKFFVGHHNASMEQVNSENEDLRAGCSREFIDENLYEGDSEGSVENDISRMNFRERLLDEETNISPVDSD